MHVEKASVASGFLNCMFNNMHRTLQGVSAVCSVYFGKTDLMCEQNKYRHLILFDLLFIYLSVGTLLDLFLL